MNALAWLVERGVDVTLEGEDNLRLTGLGRFDQVSAREMVEYARRNKVRLLAELHSGGAGVSIGGRVPRHRMEVQRRVGNWRTARSWLLAELDVLMNAGFTQQELFTVGRARYPYGWGCAWSDQWTDEPWTPSLSDEGCLRWELIDVLKLSPPRSAAKRTMILS